MHFHLETLFTTAYIHCVDNFMPKLSVLTLLEIPVPCSRLQNSMRDIGYHLCYKNATKAKRILKKVSKMLWYT